MLTEGDTIILKTDTGMLIQAFGSNACGAGEGKNIRISVFSKPLHSMEADSICANVAHSISFVGSGGKNPLKWFVNGIETTAPARIPIMMQQSVYGQVQDGCGRWSNKDSLRLYLQPRSIANTDPQSGCVPLHLVLSNRASGIFSGTVHDGRGNMLPWNKDTLQLSYLNAGAYRISLRLENGVCNDSSSVTVQVYDNPKADFAIQRNQLLEGEAITRITNFSTGGTRYIWNWSSAIKGTAEEPTFEISTEDTGIFKICLKVEDGNGCADTTCRELRVHPKPRLWFATGLSMNNDGLNERFYPLGVGIKTYQLKVFNRWGEMVFSGAENQPWSPQEQILPGVYSWRCVYTNWQGKAFEEKGTVLVIR